MFKKRPKGIDLFAAVLFVLGCSGLIYRSVQPSQLLSSAVGFLDKTYTLFILMASILCILSAVLLLLGKNIGRLGYYFLVPVFIGIFLWDQIQEIMEPPFHPEQFFFLNLMTILGQSLIPIILFGILVYFLRRPQANAFFSNQPWVSQEITDNAPSETYFQTLSEWTDFNGRIGVGAFWRLYIINLFLCLVPMIAKIGRAHV